MTKVSIIIPIYNSEKYLEQCIASVCRQTLLDIEIILVNDGSTDKSIQICDKFAELDKRIKIINKENSGMGATYNIGMNSAQGEYIGFVEADDFIDKHMFEDLYYLASKNNVDIVKSAWFQHSKSETYKNNHLTKYNSYDILNIKQNSNLLCIQATVWSAIYKNKFLKDRKVYYLETPGASYQDVSFTFKALTQAKDIIITPNSYYYYRIDNENSSINSKEKVKVIFDEYNEVDKFFEEYPDIKSWANTHKLIKQYGDYVWNYNRIAPQFKQNFIQDFAKEFNIYKGKNELNEYFYSCIDRKFLDNILRSA